MRSAILPFNIKITDSKTVPWRMLKPVTSLDIYDGMTTELNEEGLYSTSIFGRVGSEERDERFSYIHVKASIFHPEMFKALISLKQMYAGILSGSTYATWDPVEKDFIKSSALTGDTGFSFFMSHWKEIEFKETGSPARSNKIKLINTYKDVGTYRNILVLPAGLRELQIDNGRVVENEVNDLYRKVLSAANTISDNVEAADSPIYDNARWTLQNRFNDIYNHYAGMLSGKRGMLQQKWGSRRVFNSSRNVITATALGTPVLGSVTSPSLDNTKAGIYEIIRGALPLTIYLLQNGWLGKVFNGGMATLVNPKTLEPESIDLDIQTAAKWTTQEGLEKLINGFRDTRVRNKPIIINGYYLGLTYTNGKTFRTFNDIRELPAGHDKADIHPMTYTELFYLAGYKRWYTLYGLTTRYPITGMGSVYQTRVYMCTTLKSTVQQELDENWEPIPDAFAIEFPTHKRDAVFMESLSVHPTRLSLLGADYDGDQLSLIILLGDDVIAECKKALSKKETFINGRGEFLIDLTNDTLNFVLKALTS